VVRIHQQKKPEVIYLTVPGQYYYSLPHQSPQRQRDINWEDLCNQYHIIVGLEHDCSDLADGTNLTPKGEHICYVLLQKVC
jgi:hypothetical protein